MKVVATADLTALDAAVQPVDQYRPEGTIGASSAAAYAVLDRGSINMATLRYRLRKISVRIAEKGFKSGDQEIPADSFIVEAKAYEKLKAAVVPLGLTALALDKAPSVPMHEAALPRLGIYSTWGSTQNVGWIRYAFDQLETPYELIFKDELRKGGLKSKYDVVIVPSQGRSAKSVVFDIPMRGKPLPYTKTAEFPTQGVYGSSPDIRGGMGLVGVEELRKFVTDGGTLITLGDSSAVPGEFGITPDVEVSRPTKAFYAPGPIVNAKVLKPANPIFYGYTDTTLAVRWATTALLALPFRNQNDVLMSFPGGDKMVQSGLMVGACEVKDRPAIVDLSVGSGQVLMFMTNPAGLFGLRRFRILLRCRLPVLPCTGVRRHAAHPALARHRRVRRARGVTLTATLSASSLPLRPSHYFRVVSFGACASPSRTPSVGPLQESEFQQEFSGRL